MKTRQILEVADALRRGNQRQDWGLFGPGSATWKINRETVLLLGGGRALLMQVAHPSVAAGVVQHSRYDVDPWGRLLRTLDVVTAITFGDTETSERAAARLRAVHRYVRGNREDGTQYEAGDPELLRWVWATLVDTSLLVYSTYVEPVPVIEAERFYEEQKRFAQACGIPEGSWPVNYEAFKAYVHETISHGLNVGPEARDIAAHVLAPSLPAPVALVAKPSLELLKLTTLGLLPVSLREQYGYEWGPVREQVFRRSTVATRGLVGLLPGVVRQFPAAR
ncbi:MAG: DUF2236 domain-containing protein [Actinomycetota bacterium]|nr:DUF2236 domain-containing protein [Actinomycetota bacterium]